MRKHKKKIVFIAILITALVISFFITPPATHQESSDNIYDISIDNQTKDQYEKEIPYSIQNTIADDNQQIPKSDEPKTSTKTEELPDSSEHATCYLSVRCDSVLNNLENLDENKISIIPKDGLIFINEKTTVYEDESVFNVLVRELKINNIHFEYTKTPAYNSVYIEGIGNLYEFDCGELSGWLYRVNGQIPNCGCSQYTIKDQDVIEFIYSCNLGADIGVYNDFSKEQ